MIDRFLMWLGAGVVTAGVSAALLGGAGAAVADDGSSSDAGGSTTSESSNSPANNKDSTAASATAGARTSDSRVTGGAPRTRIGATTPDGTDDESKDSDAIDATDRGENKKKPASEAEDEDAASVEAKDGVVAGDPLSEEGAVEEIVAEEAVSDAEVVEELVAKSGSDRDHTGRGASAVVTPNATSVTSEEGATFRSDTDAAEKKAIVDTETDDVVRFAAEERATILLAEPVEDAVENIEGYAVQPMAFASAPLPATTATAPQIPIIIRVIGTIVFDLYALATRLLGGPPILPPNSTVTVRSSTLRIDCGCAEGEGEEVPADWYIPKTPEGAPPPDRLIYLQHGFLASAPWYSHTAAALAERTNSIVVAPSITSNFFALDACWLGGAPMHEAMAGLFDDGNTALADSARAAGYYGEIPDRVVLMGHSLGGGAVSGMAGHMARDERVGRLAGVVLLDGVALGDPARMTESLRDVPLDIPIYQLAAPVYMWNNFGSGLDALVAARPNTFVGVTLVNGSHVDSMRGGNPLIQFAQELVAGFSRPENSAAAQMLMVGWVNDMFAEDDEPKTGLYLDLGEQYSFETPAGRATVVALPNTLTKPFLLNFLRPFMSLADGFFSLDPVCVSESVGSGAGHCSDTIAA